MPWLLANKSEVRKYQDSSKQESNKGISVLLADRST